MEATSRGRKIMSDVDAAAQSLPQLQALAPTFLSSRGGVVALKASPVSTYSGAHKSSALFDDSLVGEYRHRVPGEGEQD